MKLKFRSRAEVRGEPIEFEFLDETFHCRAALPATTMFKMASLSKSNSDDPMTSVDALMMFFRDALKVPSAKRFFDILEDPENEVDMEDLNQILEGLMEVYNNRPMQEDSGSSSQSPSIGVASTHGASPQGLMYSRSPQTEQST